MTRRNSWTRRVICLQDCARRRWWWWWLEVKKRMGRVLSLVRSSRTGAQALTLLNSLRDHHHLRSHFRRQRRHRRQYARHAGYVAPK